MTDDLLKTAIQYVRAVERLRAVLSTLRASVESIKSVAELEPALAPELIAALEHITEAGEAVLRASNFVNARLEVRLEESDAAGTPDDD